MSRRPWILTTYFLFYNSWENFLRVGEQRGDCQRPRDPAWLGLNAGFAFIGA